MPGSKDILQYDKYKDFADRLIAEADVICCLDFNAIHRIDAMGEAVLASPARKLLVDHHLDPEDFAQSSSHTRKFLPPPNWCSASFAGWVTSTTSARRLPMYLYGHDDRYGRLHLL